MGKVEFSSDKSSIPVIQVDDIGKPIQAQIHEDSFIVLSPPHRGIAEQSGILNYKNQVFVDGPDFSAENKPIYARLTPEEITSFLTQPEATPEEVAEHEPTDTETDEIIDYLRKQKLEAAIKESILYGDNPEEFNEHMKNVEKLNIESADLIAMDGGRKRNIYETQAELDAKIQENNQAYQALTDLEGYEENVIRAAVLQRIYTNYALNHNLDPNKLTAKHKRAAFANEQLNMRKAQLVRAITNEMLNMPFHYYDSYLRYSAMVADHINGQKNHPNIDKLRKAAEENKNRTKELISRGRPYLQILDTIKSYVDTQTAAFYQDVGGERFQQFAKTLKEATEIF